MHIHDELLDIVDSNDTIIGQKYRTELYTENASNFRVINALLINQERKVWIPRRSANKKLFPLCLDASVGGHVMAGETYDQAFMRELKEELNLELDVVKAMLLAKLTPTQHKVSAFMHVYIIETEDEPCYNTDDFISAAWYTIPHLQECIKQGEKTKGDLPILINLLAEQLL